MDDRTVHVYAKCLTLGEHVLYDLSQCLGSESWLSHADGGEAIFAEATISIEGRPVRFRLQIGGCAVPGSFELKDERTQCIVIEHDDERMRYGAVPQVTGIAEFLFAVQRAKEVREEPLAPSLTIPFAPHPLQV